MSYRVIACHHCKNEFTATHGNRDYCPETDCQKAKASIAQKKHYEIVKDLTAGYFGNYELFEDSLGKNESKTVEVPQFQISGFDQNAFYGLFTDDNGKEWCKVQDYAFHIFHQKSDNKSYITIKKLPS
ncbi:MAG: hypothetical protein ABI675_14915 [Chitinophagaceae bacterium]